MTFQGINLQEQREKCEISLGFTQSPQRDRKPPEGVWGVCFSSKGLCDETLSLTSITTLFSYLLQLEAVKLYKIGGGVETDESK